jgi:hypothetical protein
MEISRDFLSRHAPRAGFAPPFFALAFGFAIAGPANTQPRQNMQKFVIIFHQGLRDLTDADKQLRQQQVSAWARLQNAAGHKLEPRILGPEIVRAGAEMAADSNVGIARWPVTALLFIDATNLSEAAKIAESHPALHFGASIEVRPWAPPAIPAAPSPGDPV